MGDLLPTEDQNVLDKLNSKNRQLFFLLGRENDKQIKKQICEQIQATIKEIKQRRPYQRYKDLESEEVRMRKLLEETQLLLDKYQSRKKMLQDDREKMSKIKQGYQKMIIEVKKSQELQRKIKEMHMQIMSGHQITLHLQEVETVDYSITLKKTKKAMANNSQTLQQDLKDINQQIKLFQQEIQRDQQRWDELLEQKRKLLMQLYETQGNRLNSHNVLQASTLGKLSTSSSKSGEMSGYSLKGKKKVIQKSELLLKREENKKFYVIWMIILIIWFIWLIFLRESKRQDLDNVCL